MTTVCAEISQRLRDVFKGRSDITWSVFDADPSPGGAGVFVRVRGGNGRYLYDIAFRVPAPDTLEKDVAEFLRGIPPRHLSANEQAIAAWVDENAKEILPEGSTCIATEVMVQWRVEGPFKMTDDEVRFANDYIFFRAMNPPS